MEPILFALFGAIAVGGALMVVTRKSPMSAALSLIRRRASAFLTC